MPCRNEVLAREGIDTWIRYYWFICTDASRRNEVLAREGIDTEGLSDEVAQSIAGVEMRY